MVIMKRMKPSGIVWDLETIPDLRGFAAVHDLALRQFLPRIAANDREIEYINAHALPRDGERLLVAELIARRLRGFVESGVQIPRITEQSPLANLPVLGAQPVRVAASAISLDIGPLSRCHSVLPVGRRIGMRR
jgi:hypothetical protein